MRSSLELSQLRSEMIAFSIFALMSLNQEEGDSSWSKHYGVSIKL